MGYKAGHHRGSKTVNSGVPFVAASCFRAAMGFPLKQILQDRSECLQEQPVLCSSGPLLGSDEICQRTDLKLHSVDMEPATVLPESPELSPRDLQRQVDLRPLAKCADVRPGSKDSLEYDRIKIGQGFSARFQFESEAVKRLQRFHEGRQLGRYEEIDIRRRNHLPRVPSIEIDAEGPDDQMTNSSTTEVPADPNVRIHVACAQNGRACRCGA